MTYIGSKWEKSQLISRDQIAFWYAADCDDAGSPWTDLSGKFENLTSAAPPARSIVAGYPAWVFVAGGSVVALQSASSVAPTFKTLYVLAAAANASFTEYGGLVTGKATQDCLVSDNTGTQFFDFGVGANYTKNGRYNMTDAEAPMSNLPGLIKIKSVGGSFGLDGLMVGQQRTFPARVWAGPVYEMIAWNKDLTAAEELAADQYFAQKYKQFMENSAGVKIFPFPTDWARPATRSKVVLSSVSVNQTIKQRSKTNAAKRAYELGFSDRVTPEFDAAANFHDLVHGNSSFIFRDFTRDPVEDLEAYIMSELKEDPSGYNRRSYSFSILQK